MIFVVICWVKGTSDPKSLRVTWKVSGVSVSRSAFTGTDSVAMPVLAARFVAAVATARIRPVVVSTLMFFSTIPSEACSELVTSAARSVKTLVGLLPLPFNCSEKATLSPASRPPPPFRLTV